MIFAFWAALPLAAFLAPRSRPVEVRTSGYGAAPSDDEVAIAFLWRAGPAVRKLHTVQRFLPEQGQLKREADDIAAELQLLLRMNEWPPDLDTRAALVEAAIIRSAFATDGELSEVAAVLREKSPKAAWSAWGQSLVEEAGQVAAGELDLARYGELVRQLAAEVENSWATLLYAAELAGYPVATEIAAALPDGLGGETFASPMSAPSIFEEDL